MESHFTHVGHKIARKALLILLIAGVFASQPLAKPSDQPAEIRIQIMDSRTHRPLKGHKVSLIFSGMNGRWARKWSDNPRMNGRTGSDGVAIFKVKQPIPPLMDVMDWWSYSCSNQAAYSTQEVLEHGVVAEWHSTGTVQVPKWCTANSQAPQPQSQPGKVIYFVHPVNRFRFAWDDLWR